MMKKFLIGCGIASLVALIIGAVVVWSVFIHETPVLDATLSVPGTVALDENFTMRVDVTNSHDETIGLDSIDIDNAFLNAFQVLSVEPKETETMQVPLVDQRSWSFGTPVAPGESKSITFTMKAVMAGHFSGQVDVCNPNQDWTSLFADVVVRDPAAPAGGNKP